MVRRRAALTGVRLKSYEFRREREGTWRELEALVVKAESSGIKSLSSEELLRLPSLYRAIVSSLSVARSISLDQNLLLYLESLSARTYFFVYGVRGSLADGVATFFGRRFPRAVRAARWHILTAALVLLLGVVTSFFITLNNEDWFYTFVPAEYAEGRSPASTTAELRAILFHTKDDTDGGVAETLYTFATFLFTHNAKIGMLSFALGLALGVPVIFIMFYNGLIIGAMAAVYERHGLSTELWAWLGIHGTTEMLAVVLCGGAGLVLGSSLAFPGRHSRLDTLAQNGRMASQIVIGAVAMFFVAGLLEGLARQLIADTTTRYLVAVGALIWWMLYFLRTGKDRTDGNGR